MNFNEYKEKFALYEKFSSIMAHILRKALKAEAPELIIWQISHRAKNPTSLERKLKQNEKDGSDDIEKEIKDLAGCRIILYSNDDVDKFINSGIIHENFSIDWKNSKIHYPVNDNPDPNDLYQAHHYIASLDDKRLNLPEYVKFNGLRCEIQIQTILNHAWSETGHDIIYKPLELAGVGQKAHDQIKDRMARIMKAHLMPAGHDFQKILHDFARLKQGKDLFDRGILNTIQDAANNNELFNILERYRDYVLKSYDDIPGVFDEILSTLVKAVQFARNTRSIPIKTSYGELSGKTVEDITKLAMDCVEFLLYVKPVVILETLTELYKTAHNDREKPHIEEAVGHLAEYNFFAWDQVGPGIQTALIKHLGKCFIEELMNSFPISVSVCSKALSSEITGNTSTYNSATFSRGAIVVSEEIQEIRKTALDILQRLFVKNINDKQKRLIIGAFNTAMRAPSSIQYGDDLLIMLIVDTLEIFQFYSVAIPEAPYEIRQSIEEDALWRYRRNQDLIGNSKMPLELQELAQRLDKSILTFRDKLNEDEKFARYKVLVGYESVFPEAWENPDFDFREEERYRDQEIAAYIEQINDGNWEDWIKFINRCAQTKSNDMATFSKFGQFLRQLSQSKPDLMMTVLDQFDE